MLDRMPRIPDGEVPPRPSFCASCTAVRDDLAPYQLDGRWYWLCRPCRSSERDPEARGRGQTPAGRERVRPRAR